MAICLSLCGCGDFILGGDPKNSPEENFEWLWRDFDRYYALFDVKGVDWQALYDRYRPQVTAETTDRELFDILTAMLTPLNDGHVALIAPFEGFQSNNATRVRDGFDADRIRMNYVQDREYRTGDNRIVYGRLRGEIGYIHLRSFSGGNIGAADWAADIDIALEALKDAVGMVVDVRLNGGGNALNTYAIAGRFADYEQPVFQTQTRNGPGHTDFTAPKMWSLRPSGAFQYTRPTVVLTHPFSASSAELFVLMLRPYPHVTVIGSKTAGALNSNIYRELPNGWVYRISTGRLWSPEGERVDGEGLSPDIHVPFPAESADPTRDPVLDAAIGILTE